MYITIIVYLTNLVTFDFLLFPLLGILESSSLDGRMIGFEVDPRALQIARTNLGAYSSRIHLILDSYVSITEYVKKLGLNKVMGILIDLGVSSIQLDMPERGFSFRTEAQLDMRFNPENQMTAYDVVNNFSEIELVEILKNYGEERNANRIAREIVRNRPIQTTSQLSEIIEKVNNRGKGKIIDENGFFEVKIGVFDDPDYLPYFCVTECPVYGDWRLT